MMRRGITVVFVSALLVILAFVFRAELLTAFGRWWLAADALSGKAELCVVLRGGARYERLLKGASMYFDGEVEKLLIPRSLSDADGGVLDSLGVHLRDGQERFAYVLARLGVMAEDIVLDCAPPGGGTYGEASRVLAVCRARGVKRLAVVTSWYHVRRTRLIYRDVFAESGVGIAVVPALRHGASTPENWWRFRYQALNVLLEVPKTLLYLLKGDLAFQDDPESFAPVSPCP